MTSQAITITTITETQVPAVIDLIMAQERRHHALDSRLRPPRSRDEVETMLVQQRRGDEKPFVALDAQGRVRGYVQPSLWELSPESILLAFLTARNGTALSLTLPAPTEHDASEVAAALFAALTDYWRAQHTTGDLVRWPSADLWFEPPLAEHGFLLDSICAASPPQQFVIPRRPPSPQLATRFARREDEEVLVELFQEELLFHERYIPFVRSSPEVLRAFRRKLARLWAGASLEEKAPLVIVAERANEIVGMAENTLLDISPDDDPGFTAPGRYWCLDNVSVREEARGQGIGHLLVRAVDACAMARSDLDGCLLWYNPGNPQARTFWEHMGFRPLWSTYQYLHS